jgi:serine/threonine protein kinase
MHSKGVSHRDIKASNVCFDWFGHVKLVDLGSAKPGLQGPLDIMHTVCGTPHSMAPEVVRCREHDAAGYTMSADWWSFGILVYEMLMGEPPFGYGGGGSQEREALFTSILEHDPGGCPLPRPSDELAINLIGSLLHSDPHARLVSDNVLEDVWLQSACGRDKWGDLKSHSIEAPYFRQDLGELEEEWPGAAPEHNLEAFGTDLWTGF